MWTTVATSPRPLSPYPMSAPASASSPSTMLSPSVHVQLLQQYQLTHTSPGGVEAAGEELLVASPQPSPQHQQSASSAPVDPASALPLPLGWANVRRQQLRLPSEQRMLGALRIDTNDPHLLRRGLWLACAVMYLPRVLDAEVALSSAEEADPIVGLTVAAAAVALDPASGSSSVSPPAASPDLEALGDLHVPSSFLVSIVRGGITNQLYRCSLVSHPESPILVRIYGPRTELVIDRSKENEVVDVLSLRKEGPTIWGRFENGRLESWLAGSSLTPAQMREPHLSGLIAATLARLHVQSMPFAREPVVAAVLRKWALVAQEVSFPDDAAKQLLLERLDLSRVIDSTTEYLRAIQASHYGSSSPVVFAHNDLLSGNIMHDPLEDSVKLVDFEYGNYNPRGFDFANHFCECCGFECEWEHFPRTEAQMHFIRHYLARLQSKAIADDVAQLDCEEAYAEVQCWLLAPHLFWTLWAVVQAKHSPIDFDYLAYAHQRWQAFNDMKPVCDRWMAVKPEQLAAAIKEARLA